ncbi:16S rRNA (uracil(1498)-N(3))-methyltransferase [Bacterioplanoides sp.]|uniref:16S rRNA (uracil(1498)-N(3))-methyltransferase n=1 Tax=Bacterioplanoides sp. TaxID=2066072 RepID=UPI003AFF7C79
MSGPRVFSEQPLAPQQTITLDDVAVGHLIRVLRLTDGDAIRVFNGDGHEYAAQLCDVSKKHANAQITAILKSDEPAPLALHLGQVISKGDRMDFTIQKATELGITDITPLWSERCEVKLKGDRLEKKLEHWRRVAISACEQSGRNHVPEIHTPVHFSQWCSNIEAELKFTLHPHKQKPLSDYSQPTSLALLVGPEGGFSETEVQQTFDAGFAGLTLGPRVLRTETAALAALSVFQFQWGDF